MAPTPELSLLYPVPVKGFCTFMTSSILLINGVSRTLHTMQLSIIKSLERAAQQVLYITLRCFKLHMYEYSHQGRFPIFL